MSLSLRSPKQKLASAYNWTKGMQLSCIRAQLRMISDTWNLDLKNVTVALEALEQEVRTRYETKRDSLNKGGSYE